MLQLFNAKIIHDVDKRIKSDCLEEDCKSLVSEKQATLWMSNCIGKIALPANESLKVSEKYRKGIGAGKSDCRGLGGKYPNYIKRGASLIAGERSQSAKDFKSYGR